MHMRGEPSTMQQQPEYSDVVREVTAFLRERIAVMLAAGIDRRRLWIDPGFGFGKTVEHNYALVKAGRQMAAELGVPMLAGLSRKSMIGAVTGKPVEQRMAGSVGGALAAVAHGAQIVRVHDVAETVDALKVWQAAN
jgi:dihydropteroate synthase